MEGHTWIYVISILIYLYYLTRVYDRLSILMQEKSKISEPKTDKVVDREQWIEKNANIILKISSFKRNAVLLFLLIPLLEISVHLMLSQFDLTRQLMTTGFFVLFLICLFILLYAVQGRKSDRIEKKYTWKSGVSTSR